MKPCAIYEPKFHNLHCNKPKVRFPFYLITFLRTYHAKTPKCPNHRVKRPRYYVLVFIFCFFDAGNRRESPGPRTKKEPKIQVHQNMETKNLNFAETRCDLAQFWKPRSHGAEATDKWRDQTTIKEHPDPPGFPHVKLMKTPPEDSIHCISLRRGAR